MFRRHRRSSILYVLAAVSVSAIAYAQVKETALVHYFQVSGDRDLVEGFQKEYERRLKTSEILPKYCGPVTKGKDAKSNDTLSITCKASTSSLAIGEMGEVYVNAWKPQTKEAALTMVVSAGTK
jgi:hypothetical protein